MTLAQPYYYWSEARLWTTNNSQFHPADGTTVAVPALRENDDTYIRSLWTAQFSYYSPGTGTTYGWWQGARVLLVVSSDPQALVTPSDIGGNDPLTLGWGRLRPRYDKLQGTATTYGVTWSLEESPLRLNTARSFVDAGHRPQILATLFTEDQYAFFATLEASAAAVRCQIDGRVLWASSNNGL